MMYDTFSRHNTTQGCLWYTNDNPLITEVKIDTGQDGTWGWADGLKDEWRSESIAGEKDGQDTQYSSV